MHERRPWQRRPLMWRAVTLVLALSALAFSAAPAAAATPSAAQGALDCNGFSTTQTPLKPTIACTDIRGFSNEWTANTWTGRFYDNGHYIGHDEPDVTFLSNKPGSGADVTYSETLPRDPTGAPTATSPGSDITHTFELTPAQWFSMAVCDPNSYPQTSCTPQSDSNAPTCSPTQLTNCYPGGGSAFVELQFYPPGLAPFATSISCDNSHWCAALTLDSLACSNGFASCNSNCIEPINFGWIQRDGIPTGPASPQDATLATYTPNQQTLLMNPGDRITVRMFDARVRGGGMALEAFVHDWSTGQVGWMQASAANGFMTTSMADCSGTPFNFQPEYSTASRANIVPWAALQTNIGASVETGHWESCTSLTNQNSTCLGPYEQGGPDDPNGVEPTDAPCVQAGSSTLGAAPATATGCLVFDAGGDIDFDGSPYWADWPTGTSPTSQVPGSFVFGQPRSGEATYAKYFFQTDTALSEPTCQPFTTGSTSGCAIPPPTAPGAFYPYWSQTGVATGCKLMLGNVTGRGVNDFGGDAGYGTNQAFTLGYPETIGPVLNNACSSNRPPGHHHYRHHHFRH